MSTDVRSYKHKLHQLQRRSCAVLRALIYLARLSVMQFRCCHILIIYLLFDYNFISVCGESEILPKLAGMSRDSQRRKMCSSVRVNIPLDLRRQTGTRYKSYLTS